ncbi:MAG: glycosyltransferase family 2 protein [Candidatus Aenigmarchaeota archaeon]|nr:glycosyltransferase family 2 protein [Candidatus Aenigmarchaeota archaeon]
MKIGVLLPAYNEEKNIRTVIKDVKKYLPNSEILVVDDGSTDRTNELARQAGVTVLRHEINKGKGDALNTGFEYFLKQHPEVDIVVVADTDRQYYIDEIVKIVKPLQEKKAEFVMGYRNWKKVPYANAMGNFVWRILFNLFFNTNLKDTNCGYIGLTRKAIKKIGRVRGGYIIENAMLGDAIRNEIKIKQIPVSVKYRKGRVSHFTRMFFGILIFIIIEGIKYRLSKI